MQRIRDDFRKSVDLKRILDMSIDDERLKKHRKMPSFGGAEGCFGIGVSMNSALRLFPTEHELGAQSNDQSVNQSIDMAQIGLLGYGM